MCSYLKAFLCNGLTDECAYHSTCNIFLCRIRVFIYLYSIVYKIGALEVKNL